MLRLAWREALVVQYTYIVVQYKILMIFHSWVLFGQYLAT